MFVFVFVWFVCGACMGVCLGEVCGGRVCVCFVLFVCLFVCLFLPVFPGNHLWSKSTFPINLRLKIDLD